MSLNESICKSALPRQKIYRIADEAGLCLEIGIRGTKTWRMRYRYQGKQKTISLGRYPTTSLMSARLEREQIKAHLQVGHDPAALKLQNHVLREYNSAQTFEQVAREWHGNQIGGWDNRYAQTIMHRLEKYVFPAFGGLAFSYIKPIIILDCLKNIERSAPEMARRVKQIISYVFKYAIVTGRSETNPTLGLEVALLRYRKGHFASLDIKELPRFLSVLDNHKSRLYRQTYLAIRLMLLTFVRTAELLEAKWEEVDFENAQWIIPANRMKMKTPHIVPLSGQALSILSELKDLNPFMKHIFPSIPRPQKPMSKGTILVSLKRMGFSGQMTGHGFRALAMGILKEKLGFSHEVVDRQLAHAPRKSVDRAYDRATFLDKRTEMMQRFADYIDEISFPLPPKR
jgi:integrase